MSSVAHALICYYVPKFEYYVIFFMIFLHFTFFTFTEKINFLLVKQENFDQQNSLFLNFKLFLRSSKKITNIIDTVKNLGMGYQGHKAKIFKK